MLALYACGSPGDGAPIPRNTPASFVTDAHALRPLLLPDEDVTARYLEAFPRHLYHVERSPGVGRFYIDHDDDVIKGVIAEGDIWEPEIRTLLMQYIRPGTAVLDVGAHIGTHTMTMARATGQQGHVFAFEPQKKLFRELQMNIGLNELGNVTPLRFAAGSGEPRLVQMDPSFATNEGGTAVGSGGDDAELRTLDGFGFKDVSVIKIDAEGHEAQVLAGAARTIAAFRPVLIVEIMGGTEYASATAEERVGIDRVKTQMRDLGYIVTQVTGHDYLGVPIVSADSAPGGSRKGSIGISR